MIFVQIFNIVIIKKIAFYIVIATIFFFLTNGSCDKTECGEFWFINRTTHRVKINSYTYFGLITDMSYEIQQIDSISKVTCDMGMPSNPFTSNYFQVDSIVIVFDDTLSINIFKYLEYNSMNFKVRKKNKFVYEITDSLYCKTLEINGYSSKIVSLPVNGRGTLTQFE